MKVIIGFLTFLNDIDRRIIYLFVAISLAIPLVLNVELPPAEMMTAEAFYGEVERLPIEKGKVVLIAVDWGPNTLAENKGQFEVAIEHLMRRRIAFALITTYPLAEPFMKSVPLDVAKRLTREIPNEHWAYGRDWVNLGYRPGGGLMIQSLAKADNLHAHLIADSLGTPLEDIPAMQGVKTIKDITMLMEFTGLAGALQNWIQFFQAKEYRPPFVHGCTSITIPEGHLYFASGQLVGFFEGVAGAAWYDTLLSRNYPNRLSSSSIRYNTGLAYAHLVVIAFIIIGNVGLIATTMHVHTKNQGLE